MFRNFLKRLKTITKWLSYLALIMAASVCVKTFVTEIYHIPTASMSNTLLPGDYIMINKLNYGPRLPQSPLEISWFNLFSLIKPLQPWFKETQWGYRRWPLGKAIQRNDVVVFEDTQKTKTTLVKRCIGLPGDTVLLEEDEISINGTFIPQIENINYHYSSDQTVIDLEKYKLNLTELPSTHIQNQDHYIYRLHPDTARSINKKHPGDNLIALKYFKKAKKKMNKQFVIPKKGMTVNLSNYKSSMRYYVQAIANVEDEKIEVNGDEIIIDGHMTSTFTFKNDYYFFMGDNRHGSQDSRVWGFIPEKNIISKAILIVSSSNPTSKDIRWERMLTRIK